MELNYTLPRDAAESARLDEQHEWLIDMVGCLIHPAIPVNQPNLRIADVATGTAIWLLDAAKVLPPDSELHGFDVSILQFPAAETLPGNVVLHEQNALEPFPVKFIDYFDVVQVRLMTLGIRGNDWDNAVKNISKLIKPGGCIQWIEPDHSKMRVFNEKPGVPNSAAQELGTNMRQISTELMFPGPLRLPELYEKNGLEIAALDIFATSRNPAYRKYHTVNFISSGGPMILSKLVKGGFMSEEYADDLLKRSLKEIINGDLYTHSEMHFVVGRKP